MSPTLGNGKICYVEIPTDDPRRSAEFYEGVFGWKSRTRGDGRLAFDDGVGQVSGAWVTGRPPLREPGLLVYVMVDRAEAVLESIAARGGVVVEPIDPSRREIVARFADPFGNVLGIYQEPARTAG